MKREPDLIISPVPDRELELVSTGLLKGGGAVLLTG